MAPGWRYRQHRCDWDGCRLMATDGNYCVEHGFLVSQEEERVKKIVPSHPCNCTNPRQTCGTCRADMNLRNPDPSAYPCAENIACYGAPQQVTA